MLQKGILRRTNISTIFLTLYRAIYQKNINLEIKARINEMRYGESYDIESYLCFSTACLKYVFSSERAGFPNSKIKIL